MRRAEAVLQALMMMSSSIRPSLMSPGAVDCSTKTRSRGVSARGGGGRAGGSTVFVADGLADCDGGFLVGVLEDHDFGQLDAQTGCVSAVCSGEIGGLVVECTGQRPSWPAEGGCCP